MRARILTSAVGLPVLLLILFMGKNYISLAVLLVSLLALYEFYSAFKSIEYKPVNIFGYLATIILYAIYFWHLEPIFYGGGIAVLLFGLLIYGVISTKTKIVDLAITLLGFLYISCSFIYIALVSEYDNHFFIWYVFLIAWITDTFAYFAGRLFGKRKLIERVSPKKTIAGAIGGVIGSTVVVVLFAYILKREFVPYAFVLGIIGSVLSQFGDLIASQIKRYCQIKDFGDIFPGHGGILDRFDSILLTAPFVYYFMRVYQWISCYT